MGAHVTVISRGQSKKAEAVSRLGADEFLDSTDGEAMKAATGSFDFIIDTIAAKHNLEAYVNLLGMNGRLVCGARRWRAP